MPPTPIAVALATVMEPLSAVVTPGRTAEWSAPHMKTARRAGVSPGFFHRCRVPFCTTVSPGSQGHFGAVVEFQHDGAFEHHLEVDRVGGVHAGIRSVHVPEQSRQLRPRSLRGPLRRCRVRARRVLSGGNENIPNRKPPMGGKYKCVLGHRAVVGELRRVVATPESVRTPIREHRGLRRLDGLVADEHGLAGSSCPVTTRRTSMRISQSPRACNPAAYLSKESHLKKGTLLLSQREISIAQLTATRASGAVVWIRLYVGLIFVGEGFLKFLRPEALGPGRFAKVDIPFSTFTAYLDGVFEIGCGLRDLRRPAHPTRDLADDHRHDRRHSVFTKVPLLFGSAALYPKEHGFWDFFHEGTPRDRDVVRQHLPAHRRRGQLLVRQPDEPREDTRTCHRCRGLATPTAISKVESRTVMSDREPE